MNKMKDTISQEGIWVFAYGSLCWSPCFEYEEMVAGHIKGFVRRFWQGNTVHRGTLERPGRVATLIADSHGEVYGCAFRVSPSNSQKTLKYLEQRETKLGGYDSKMTMFYPVDKDLIPVKTRLYIALPGNIDWKGPGKSEDIADEVLTATGICGSNIDYVTDLADFLRSHNFKDDHLFELESIILRKVKELELEESTESSSSSGSSLSRRMEDLEEDMSMSSTTSSI